MFSMCSELTPRTRIPDTRIPQLMQPWSRPKLGAAAQRSRSDNLKCNSQNLKSDSDNLNDGTQFERQKEAKVLTPTTRNQALMA